MTDDELVARARGGAQEAWAELVHRHHAAVFRTAHAALLSHVDADDAAQDAWIAAWKHLGEFRGQASFRTWVLTIVWRKALDRRRSVVGWLRALRLDRHGESDDDARAFPPIATAPSAEMGAIDRQQRRRIGRLLKGLPRGHRDALLLMATRDLPYAEAATLLGVPVGTLKWRVSEARRLLRARLEGHADVAGQTTRRMRESGR